LPGRERREKTICQTVLKSCPILDMMIQTREDVARLKGDVRWMKWLLVIILAALLGTAAFV